MPGTSLSTQCPPPPSLGGDQGWPGQGSHSHGFQSDGNCVRERGSEASLGVRKTGDFSEGKADLWQLTAGFLIPGSKHQVLMKRHDSNQKWEGSGDGGPAACIHTGETIG